MRLRLCRQLSMFRRHSSEKSTSIRYIWAILAGTEPEGMSITKITAQPIPEDWNEQRRLYGFPVR